MNNVKVIFEDENLVAYDKPSGLVVNKSQTATGPTLAEYSSDYLDIEEKDDIESDFYSRGGIVHRLDKDTSGIVLAAKNLEYFEYLQSLFKQRKVNKTYLAICIGKMREDEITVAAPIARNPNNRFKFAVVDGGKDSRTSFKKLKVLTIDDQEFTIVEAKPITGRTHQIRVHLTALNIPIAGDELYLSKRLLARYQELFPRLMLHAHRLSFTDERTQKEFDFISPIPNEFNLD
jgi:23S rRNA pseudouridine1911/1915/1917 synthase